MVPPPLPEPLPEGDDVLAQLAADVSRPEPERRRAFERLIPIIQWVARRMAIHRLWSSALATHRERTGQLANYRRESLNTSHKARLGLLNDQLSSVADERIRRMRLSQIQAAEDDYDRRLGELRQAETTADIIHSTVAFGILEIVR